MSAKFPTLVASLAFLTRISEELKSGPAIIEKGSLTHVAIDNLVELKKDILDAIVAAEE